MKILKIAPMSFVIGIAVIVFGCDYSGPIKINSKSNLTFETQCGTIHKAYCGFTWESFIFRIFVLRFVSKNQAFLKLII